MNDSLSIYPNNLKSWEFDKEVPQIFCSERATIAERQGASENKQSETEPTRSKTNFSSCLGIYSLNSYCVHLSRKSLKHLIRSQELNLSSRNLSLFPQNLTFFTPLSPITNLTKLDLSDNHFTRIPPQIKLCTQLRWLDFSYNDIEVVTPELYRLSSLEFLDLSWNKITELSSQIEKLRSLKYLLLISNQLIYIPKEIESLPSLQLVDITYNPCSTPPLVHRVLNKLGKWLKQHKIALICAGVGLLAIGIKPLSKFALNGF